MGFLESLPVRRSEPVLALPLFSGSLRDASIYGNHPAHTGGNWAVGDGADGYRNGLLTVPADKSLLIDRLTFFMAGRFVSSGKLYEYPLRLTDDSLYFFLYTGRSVVLVYDGATSSNIAYNNQNVTSIAFTVDKGPAKAQFYKNGIWENEGDDNITIAPTLVDWEILGTSAATWPVTDPTSMVLAFPDVLTAAEILELHDWALKRRTPRQSWAGHGNYSDNIQTARVSLADESDGTISTTPYIIDTGDWRIAEDQYGRYIDCIAQSQIRRESDQAYGRWDFRFTHGVGTARIIFVSDNVERESNGNQYYLEFASDLSFRVTLRRTIADAGQNLFLGKSWTIQSGVPYDYRIERTATGEFTVWISGNQYHDWTLLPHSTGTNPVTDNNNQTCRYITYWLQPGDKLYLDEARA